MSPRAEETRADGLASELNEAEAEAEAGVENGREGEEEMVSVREEEEGEDEEKALARIDTCRYAFELEGQLGNTVRRRL